VTRLRTFIDLLLETGCDVSDAIQHDSQRVEWHTVNGKRIAIYRYHRQKTGVQAIIPITKALAKNLDEVPAEDGCVEGMPFRRAASTLKPNQQLWSKRVQQALKVAGVEWVTVPSRHKDGRLIHKPANVKQFRHTAAIRWLVSGHSAEDTAKMLGHVDTEMVFLHYGPWVAALDQAFIQRVSSPVRKRS
jgi:integrase